MKVVTLVFIALTISLLQADSQTDKNIKKQMELEKKYAKEQKFYQGKDYNLSQQEVDKDSLKNVPDIKPDYDFDITDVYRDDI